MSKEYIIRIVVDTECEGKAQRRALGTILAPLGSQWKIGLDNDIAWDDLIQWAKLLHAQCQDAERELHRVKGQLSAERSRRRAAEVQLRRLKGDEASPDGSEE